VIKLLRPRISGRAILRDIYNYLANNAMADLFDFQVR
jgi:hypothetical protein